KINKFFKGDATNVAYVTPLGTDVGETSPLVIPPASTDASTTGTNNDASAPITVLPLVSVGDYVWRDANRDGIQDSGETPVKNVTVILYDAAGAEVARTTTDANGFYSFEDLLPGTDYEMEFVVPDGMKLSPTGAGTAGTDSDPDPATGKVAFTTDADGNNSLTAPDMPGIDAGLIPKTFAVSNFVWFDTNRDGIQDAGELPVKDVTVTLVNPDGSPAKDLEGNDIAAVLTDADGFYVIDDVPAGDYQVTFTTLPSGAKFTQTGAGTDATDSTPAVSTGVTPTFTLGLNETNVRDVAAGDGTLVAEYINPTIDAGILQIDLELAKAVTSSDPYYAGSTVTFELTPKNNGPVDALAGWKVTEVLPPGLTLVSMTGTGYTCVDEVCTADDGLAALADGPVITVTAKINKFFKGDATNVAYVTPLGTDVGETSPLVIPPASNVFL
ncbi:MAG: SdrD B-like domain-containing protein, partial [Angustibacter sp.]